MSDPPATAPGQCKTSVTDAVNSNNGNSHSRGRNAQAAQGPSAVSGDPSKESKTFEFVLVTDSGSRKQVRRHAMRQYVHQRRLDGIARLESSRVPLSGWVKARHAGEPEVSSKVEELDDDDHPRDHGDPDKHSPGTCGSPNNGRPFHSTRSPDTSGFPRSTNNDSGSKLDLIQLANPRASPSSTASDPFNSFPMQLNRWDRNLVHHFINTYPLMMYQMNDPHRENPIKTIFHQLALHNIVSFQAMLAVAAKHRAGVEGQVDTVQSLTHKMRTLRLINEHLQCDARSKDDGVLYAVASMAVIEKWSKDASVERMHFQGVRHLVQERGGMRGLRGSSQFVENIMYWVDFSCAPNAIFGTSLPWTGLVPDEPPASVPFLAPPLHVPAELKFSTEINDQSNLDIMQLCEDFLSFFRSLNELQLSLLDYQPPPSVDTDNQHLKPIFFGPSTPLYTILTSLPDYDHGIRDVRFIDEYTCMACLLYLNVALYDYYFKSRDFNSYLEWVSLELHKLTSHLNPSVASLLWIFLNNGGFPSTSAPDDGERSWVVSRMLRVAKRLEWKRAGAIWDNLRSILINSLVTQEECEIGSNRISEAGLMNRKKRLQNPTTVLWDEAEMRQNILGQLYEGSPVFMPVP